MISSWWEDYEKEVCEKYKKRWGITSKSKVWWEVMVETIVHDCKIHHEKEIKELRIERDTREDALKIARENAEGMVNIDDVLKIVNEWNDMNTGNVYMAKYYHKQDLNRLIQKLQSNQSRQESRMVFPVCNTSSNPIDDVLKIVNECFPINKDDSPQDKTPYKGLGKNPLPHDAEARRLEGDKTCGQQSPHNTPYSDGQGEGKICKENISSALKVDSSNAEGADTNYTLEEWIKDSDLDGRGILFQFTDSDIPILRDCVRQKIEEVKINQINSNTNICANCEHTKGKHYENGCSHCDMCKGYIEQEVEA